jgi:signal transduction histidine kinase
MKKAIAFMVTIFCVANLYAQTNVADSLKQLLKTETKDTSRVVLLVNLALTYQHSKPDTMLLLAQQALSLSKKAGFTKGEAGSLNIIATVFLHTGNYPKSLEAYLQALKKYHGLRAKDKSFNATMKSDFDESIGKINLIPQDMGRVILNLFNNAFYAVGNKKKANGFANGEKYEPTVSVTTKKIDGHISIHVKDNGNGIPKNIADKIFQPFFTIKPTGEGTGLGLSLSYDIVKAHSGEIKVESKEGEGSEFVIQLPVV